MKKTTNINPYHCEIACTVAGFALTFYDKTESGMDLRYVVHFDFWWVKHLAYLLWKAIAYRRESVIDAEASMRESRP